MTEPTATVVICDAGPLIHLDELGCLGLLADFAGVLVSPTVWAETERMRPECLKTASVRFQLTQPARPPAPAFIRVVKLFVLHAGEREALMVALEHPGGWLLSDDTAARLAAGQLGLRVQGTLGILLRAIRRGQKSREEVAALLREIPGRSTLHLKRTLLREIIERVQHGEE